MAHGLSPRQLRDQMLATPLAHYRAWRFVVCCGECQDGARHLAIGPLTSRHPGITVAQAVARMRCQIGGQRCGATPSHVRIEESDGPERGDRLQVVLRGGPVG